MGPMPLGPAGEAEVPRREGDHKLTRMSAQGQTAGRALEAPIEFYAHFCAYGVGLEAPSAWLALFSTNIVVKATP
ncbi:MAG: hypothetical protein CISAcid_10500 [uncultured Acidilobus sp. CIS]|jgi:hypothetical protein|nr:MAG: hypothetical protein CISAcid_10500 [uncultured Acidilobus sp. CIS]